MKYATVLCITLVAMFSLSFAAIGYHNAQSQDDDDSGLDGKFYLAWGEYGYVISSAEDIARAGGCPKADYQLEGGSLPGDIDLRSVNIERLTIFNLDFIEHNISVGYCLEIFLGPGVSGVPAVNGYTKDFQQI